MKQLLVILNPCAGTKRGNRALAQVLDIFCRGGFEPIVRTTQKQGDAIALATQYASRVDRIVCIGGDGTFNEVVTGVLRSGVDVPIGYIPAGSTNDFAASLGLSTNLRQAAIDIVRGKPVAFDVGRFQDRNFTYVASFGAFTRTSYATSQSVKNNLGHLAYLLGGIAAIPSIHSLHVAMETGEGERIEGDYLFGAVGNSTSMGGVLTLDKSLVDMRDGKFELLLVKKPADARELAECIRALLAQDYASPMLVLRQTDRVVFFPPKDMPWTLDGEYGAGSDRVEIEALPGAMNMLVNP